MAPQKILVDLGCGKGFPSLLWASVFGVHVEGYDLEKNYVAYANARAKMLNLSQRVRFFCQDVKELRLPRAYDVVASLGLGIAHVFGNISDGLQKLHTMLREGGFLIFAEPVWLVKDIPAEVLESLNAIEEHFLTKCELQQAMKQCGYHVQGSFDSTKEEWELYIQPVTHAMREIIESGSERAEEAQRVIQSFKAEYDAVNQYWNMVLWVAQA